MTAGDVDHVRFDERGEGLFLPFGPESETGCNVKHLG
jgi:hypothetical protein